MEARLTKDVVTQASICIIGFVSCLFGLLAVASAEPSPFEPVELRSEPDGLGSTSPHSEVQTSLAPAEPVVAAPEKPIAVGNRNNVPPLPTTAVFWVVAAAGVLLVGISSGAIAALLVLRGRRDTPTVVTFGSESDHFEFSPADKSPPVPRLLDRSHDRFLAMRIHAKRWLHHAVKNSSDRLRRLIPSRRTILRVACLLVGCTLVGLSLYGFTIGRLLESSILLPVGYGIATCFWLLAWKREQIGPDAEEVAYLARGMSPFAESAQQKGTVPLSAFNSTPRPPHVAFTADTVDNLPALSAADTVENVRCAAVIQPSNSQPLSQAPPGYAVLLRCAPCGKHFNVRGQGEIAFRLVPCPDCGSAMESLGPKRPNNIPADPNWVPIVSVFCKSCRSLIDVPYSTFGSSISCPRCHADLSVPQIARAAVQPSSTQSQLMPA